MTDTPQSLAVLDESVLADLAENVPADLIAEQGAGALRFKLAAATGAALLILVLGVASLLGFQFYQEAGNWLEHTSQVRLALAQIEEDIASAEGTTRGYIITGDERYMALGTEARATAERHLGELRTLIMDDTLQRQRVNALSAAAAARLDTVFAHNTLRRERGLAAAAAAVESGTGFAQMTTIRALSAQLEGSELALLRRREALQERRARVITIATIAGTLVAFLLAMGTLLAIRRELRTRERARVALERQRQVLARLAERLAVQHTSLEHQFEEQQALTEELTQTNDELERARVLSNRAMRELGGSEERFRSLVRASAQIVWRTGGSGQFETVQPEWSSFTGQSEDELRGWGWLDAIHPEDRAEAERAWARARETQSIYEDRHRLRRADGAFRHVEVKAVPVLDADGQVEEWVGVHTDVTERTVAKAERDRLEVERDRLAQDMRLFIDSGDDGIYAIDVDGNCTIVNRSAAEMLGYASHELVGANMHDLVHHHREDGRPYPESECPIARAMRAGGRSGRITGEVFWRRDRSPLQVEYSSSTIVQDGMITGAVVAFTDITVRRAAASEIDRLLGERTEQVRALVAANSGLESFSYTVSHDLRGPLGAISGIAHILDEDYGDRLDDEGRRLLGRVRANASHMAELIEGLLALARVSSVELHTEVVDVSALASRILANLARDQATRAVTVRVEPSLAVCADRRLLEALLQNLLHNAWKYTSKTPDARIEVGHVTPSAVADDDSVTLFVRDNGAGFDMAYSAKLFAAFQRLHDASEFEGTGVGLATVQRVVQRHGGRVWAEAAVGQGATFFVTLPGLRARATSAGVHRRAADAISASSDLIEATEP